MEKKLGENLKENDIVIVEGRPYEVIFNPFFDMLVLDADCGQDIINLNTEYTLGTREEFDKHYENHGY